MTVISIALPPLPAADALTGFFWEAVARHELMMLRCQRCQHYVHYPRPICPRCQSEDLAPESVSGKGSLYSHTQTVQAFHPFWADKLPYVVAIVELVEEPGLRMVSNLVNCPDDQRRIGLPVEVDFVEVAQGLTLPIFRPAVSAQERP